MEEGKIELSPKEKETLKALFKALSEAICNGKQPKVKVNFSAGGVLYTSFVTLEILEQIRARAYKREHCEDGETREPLSIWLKGKNGTEKFEGEVCILRFRFAINR